MSVERYYDFKEALGLSGLSESRFRFLEREFGRFLGLGDPLFSPSVFSRRQIGLLRKIDEVLRRQGRSADAVKEALDRFVSAREKGLRILAVTSGKGGVGKTSVAVNLAVAMAGLGARPTLVDADLGTANAHLLLGVLPEADLQDVVCGSARMEDVLVETAWGVFLVPGSSGSRRAADLSAEDRDFLSGEIKRLCSRTDTIIVDTGSGISSNVTRFLSAADDILVVATPNVASCLDALAIIRAAHEAGVSGRISVLMNRCQDDEQGRRIFCRLHRAAAQIAGADPWYLGYVPEDRHFEESFQKGTPLAVLHPTSKAGRQITHLARTVLAGEETRKEGGKSNLERLFQCLAG